MKSKTIISMKLFNSRFIAISITVLLAFSFSCKEKNTKSAPPQDKPNIIVFITDDMNYTGPSCYGARWGIKTPNIDQMAEEGIRFTNAYSTSPSCGPTRAALVTGRYQTSFGHEFNTPIEEGKGLPLSERTFGERLKELGYKTGLIGKWHLGGSHEVGDEYHPLNRGFDYFFGFHGSKVSYFRSKYIFRGKEQIKDERYVTDILSDESCKFIEQNKANPFFLYIPFHAPHDPLDAKAEDLAHVDSLSYFEDYVLDLAKEPSENPDQIISHAKQRAATLLAVDRAVGKVNSKLKELGLEKNTLVIFTNDNGDHSAYNTLLNGGKRNAMEGGVKIPMILKWPDVLDGAQTFNKLTSLLDIAPTVINAGGGIVMPDWDLHGVDLIPYLSDDTEGSPHEWLFWRMGGTKAALHGQWKIFYNGESYGDTGGYGANQEDARWFLFNLESDPSEKYDLSKVFPEIFQKMLSKYQTWDEQQSEPLWNFGGSGQLGQWEKKH